MPLRHYDGPLLPVDPTAPSPVPADAPSSVSPVPVPPPRPPAASATPEPRVAPPAIVPPEYRGVTVVIQGTEPGAVEVIGVGPTVQDAVGIALNKWAAAQVQPLVWADGRKIDGLARQVLVEALELYEVQAAMPPEVRTLVRGLTHALSTDEEGEVAE